MGDVQTYNFDTASNYTFSDAELSAGSALQSTQIPTNSIVGAKFATMDANWNTEGVLTATLNNTPTLSGGKLVCDGVQGLYYAVNSKGIGTIKCLYTPDYTGAPSSSRDIVSISEGTSNNRVVFYHSSSNFLTIILYDNAGSLVFNYTYGGVRGFVSGTEYELEVNWNNTTGNSRVFQNGALLVTRANATWTHGSGAARLYVGANPDFLNSAEGSFDDVISYDNEQHTATYTAGYTLVDTLYPLTAHVQAASAIAVESLASYIETTTLPSTTEIKHSIDVGGSLFYFVGSILTASDGSISQSNSLVDFQTSIAAYSFTVNSEVKKRWVFGTGGNETALLDMGSLEYDFGGIVVAEDTCNVYGKLYDNQVVVAGATILFKMPLADFGDKIISINESVITDANGYFDITLPRTTNINKKVTVYINYTDANGKKQSYSKKFLVANAISQEI